VPAAAPLPPLLTRPFLALLVAQASFGFSFASFFLLPKFVITELHAAPSDVGLVMASFGVASIVFIPLVGSWIDRFGRRPFVTAGGCVMFVAALGFLAVDRIGPLIYALRMLQGVGFSMAFISMSTMVTDQAPRERLGQAIGVFGVSILSMHAIAPAIAEEVAERFGWQWVFASAAAAAALCIALSRGLGERPLATHDATGAGLFEVALRPRSLRIVAVVALTGAAFGVMMTYPQPFSLELGRTQVRGFFIAYASAAVAMRLCFGTLADRVGRHRVSIGSLVVYGAAVLSMVWLRPSWLEPIGIVFGSAHGLFYPAFNALAVEPAAPDERGKLMALFNGGFNLGNSGATLTLGFVAERAGYPVVFAIAAAGAFAALILLVLSPEGRRAPVSALPLAAIPVTDPG
jgi:MFS family permease